MPVMDDIQQSSTPFGNIPAFVQWLKTTMGGEIERVPPGEDPMLNSTWPANPDPNPTFSQSVIPVIEEKLDRLVREFLVAPSTHRREHNLHSELYASLTSDTRFCWKGSLSNGAVAQLIQQEWPERPYKERLGNFDLGITWPGTNPCGPSLSVKRGLYDLAVLSPECLTRNDETVFLNGLFPPVIAMEFGLIENYDHLRADAAKLVNNKVAHGYLVHFVRQDQTDNFSAVESLIEKLAKISTVRTVYARVERNSEGMKYHYKMVGDEMVQHSDTQPSARTTS